MHPNSADPTSSPILWGQGYPAGFPIAVDLDGTLFPYHVMWRPRPALSVLASCGLRSLFQRRPWPWFKHTLVSATWSPPSSPWPLHQPLLDLLVAWKNSGCYVILCTGAPQAVAESIAQPLDLFDDVWSSHPTCNLVGSAKASSLRNAFGSGGFTYIGDSWQDPPVWRHSRDIIAVTSPQSRLALSLQRWVTPSQRLSLLPHPLS